MSSGHLIDPELCAFVEAWPKITLDDAMMLFVRRSPVPTMPPADEDTYVERFTVHAPGVGGTPEVSLIVYRPRVGDATPLPAILHMHGGGYLTGSAEMMEPYHRPIVAELGCVLVSVNYRLAPETPFPGPLDDCYAGLAWLMRHAAELNVDLTCAGVMGESAGGGLAAALALLARDRGEYRLAFQHLIAPMIDDRTCVASDPHLFAGEYIWTQANNRYGWRSYLGVEPGTNDVLPYAAAARMNDLTDLPPTFISTGALDLFAEEDMDYARRLMRAGVPTELHVYPGAVHGFALATEAAITRRAFWDSRNALARALGKT